MISLAGKSRSMEKSTSGGDKAAATKGTFLFGTPSAIADSRGEA
jgi:hypothetical protein